MEPGNQAVLPNQPEQSTPATAEQPLQNSSGEPETLSASESSVQPGPLSSPGSSEQPGPSAKVTTEEGQPRNKRRKLNKQEKAGKVMQKMVDTFVASEEKARKEFLELEKQKMEMEKEQARNEEKREERFLRIMRETILMMCHPTPVPQPIPQPQQGSDMYHFDLPPFHPEPEDEDY